MQITIQGSGRRIKLTKGETAKLKSAMSIAAELANQAQDGDAMATAGSLNELLKRIDTYGVYTEPTTEAAK